LTIQRIELPESTVYTVNFYDGDALLSTQAVSMETNNGMAVSPATPVKPY
jgi:hypothetical protein